MPTAMPRRRTQRALRTPSSEFVSVIVDSGSRFAPPAACAKRAAPGHNQGRFSTLDEPGEVPVRLIPECTGIAPVSSSATAGIVPPESTPTWQRTDETWCPRGASFHMTDSRHRARRSSQGLARIANLGAEGSLTLQEETRFIAIRPGARSPSCSWRDSCDTGRRVAASKNAGAEMTSIDANPEYLK